MLDFPTHLHLHWCWVEQSSFAQSFRLTDRTIFQFILSKSVLGKFGAHFYLFGKIWVRKTDQNYQTKVMRRCHDHDDEPRRAPSAAALSSRRAARASHLLRLSCASSRAPPRPRRCLAPARAICARVIRDMAERMTDPRNATDRDGLQTLAGLQSRGPALPSRGWCTSRSRARVAVADTDSSPRRP